MKADKVSTAPWGYEQLPCPQWKPWPHMMLQWPGTYWYTSNMSCSFTWHDHTDYVLSCERALMGRAPYKSAEEGGGHSFKCFHTTKEHSCHVYANWMPTKQITGQTIMHNGTTNHQGLRRQIMTADNTLDGTCHAKIGTLGRDGQWD